MDIKTIIKIIYLSFLLFFTVNIQPVFAKEKKLAENDGVVKKIAEDDKGIFNFILENDLFTGTDLGYTNGVRISYISPETNMPDFIKKASSYLPLQNEGKKRISIAAGQSMYTPSDITKSEFTQNDFLYAGWLYGSLGIVSDTGQVFDNIVLTLGMVGPSSKAQQSQEYIHHVIGSPQPQGWDHQLKDELGINFAYERKWRKLFEAEAFGTGVDVMPHIGANLGNISTNASVGATFRLGYDLPSDYGPPRIRPSLPGSDFFIPSKKISGYLFSVVEMRAVGRNIFLDGNTFQNSPHLNKRNMIGSLQIGSSLTYKDSRLSYTHAYITKEFKGQKNGSQFGAITFSYRF